MLYSDRSLSQKLEHTEGRTSTDFAQTRVRLDPTSTSAWRTIGGAHLIYDGIESPLTQTFGLGLFTPTTAGQLDEIEEFFQSRNAPVFHEVSPMTDPSLMTLLGERGYRPIELTNVLFRMLGKSVDRTPNSGSEVKTRVIEPSEAELWATTSADAWTTEDAALADFMLEFGRVSAQCSGAYPFIGELGDRPIATGMLFVFDEIAFLAGASTIPEGRNRGAQNALLSARLTLAAEKGCEMAMMGAAPGSQSQKNAQRNGFQIAYTRTKWQLIS